MNNLLKTYKLRKITINSQPVSPKNNGNFTINNIYK